MRLLHISLNHLSEDKYKYNIILLLPMGIFRASLVTLINRMLLIIVALTFFTVDMKVDIHIKSVKAEVVKEIIVLSSSQAE